MKKGNSIFVVAILLMCAPIAVQATSSCLEPNFERDTHSTIEGGGFILVGTVVDRKVALSIPFADNTTFDVIEAWGEGEHIGVKTVVRTVKKQKFRDPITNLINPIFEVGKTYVVHVGTASDGYHLAGLGSCSRSRHLSPNDVNNYIKDVEGILGPGRTFTTVVIGIDAHDVKEQNKVPKIAPTTLTKPAPQFEQPKNISQKQENLTFLDFIVSFLSNFFSNLF